MYNNNLKYQSHTLEVANTVLNTETGCNIIQLQTVRKSIVAGQDNLYTSHGKRKAQASDALKKQEDILKLEEYFLTTGIKKNRLRNYTLFVLGISIGLRGSDLLSLNVGDVFDVKTNSINNRIAVYERKTRKINYPMLNSKCKTAITEYLKERFKDNSKIDIEAPLFPSTRARMDLTTLYKILNKACEELNIQCHVGTHTLRKTFVYWQLKLHPNNNNILIMVQQMLNHGDPTVTLRYAGITDDDKEVLYNDIERVFDNSKIDNSIDENSNDESIDIDCFNFD